MRNTKPSTRANTSQLQGAGRKIFRDFNRDTVGGFALAFLAMLAASIIGMVIEAWVQYYNLLLLYVLAAFYIGLRCGVWPAWLATALVIPNVSYFLAAPLYDFAVHSKEEWTTLLHMTAISAVSGQAAARIREQFMQLAEANRSSQALIKLGHRLLAASDVPTVWQALIEELSQAIGVECRLLTRQDDGCWRAVPSTLVDLDDRTCAAIDRVFFPSSSLDSLELMAITIAKLGPCMVFPIAEDRALPTGLLVAIPAGRKELKPADTELVAIMAQHTGETWRRIEIATELDEAKRSNDREQLRSALLSSVSHDLKSPLSAMMGAAESLLLLEYQLSRGDRRELVSTILQESQRLESYIQNLLDMTRLEHGALSIERDWVPLDDLIGSAMGRLQRYHPEVQVDYHPGSSGQLLWVNGGLIEQAFFNILENAAKYSPQGEPILITASVVDEHCRVEIEDRGPGIPEASREAIFDMFHVVAKGDKGQSGTGMGLAICRGMVAAHGGTVRAEAGADGTGTRMVVELPTEQVP